MCWEDKRDPAMVAQVQEKNHQISRLTEDNKKLKEEIKKLKENLEDASYELMAYQREEDEDNEL